MEAMAVTSSYVLPALHTEQLYSTIYASDASSSAFSILFAFMVCSSRSGSPAFAACIRWLLASNFAPVATWTASTE